MVFQNPLRKTTQDLIQELFDASQMYYQDGKDSPLTDDEFDEKLDYLRDLEKEVPELFSVNSQGYQLLEKKPGLGTTTTAEKTVIHNIPMLSLEKAKTEETLIKFLNKMSQHGAIRFNAQAKLDGIALSIIYYHGKLQEISTRGNGEIGENVTYLKNAEYLTTNIPHSIDTSYDKIELRGEIYMTCEDFTKTNEQRYSYNGEKFKNQRNAVAGIISRARLGLSYHSYMTFTPYSIIIDNIQNSLSKTPEEFVNISVLTEQITGLCMSDLSVQETIDVVHCFGPLRKELPIPTDGIVIKPSNESEMIQKLGNTTHHPLSQIAYKYPGDTARTMIKEINYTVGSTGRITPVAKIDPVILTDTVISNVTLHNFHWIREKDIRIGSTITITRANDVIPYVKAVLTQQENSERITAPMYCPSCQQKIFNDSDGKTILCKNINCPGRNLNNIINAVSKKRLNIDRMSDAIVEKLFIVGRVENIADIFTLTVDDLKNLVIGTEKNQKIVGLKHAEHMVEYIDRAKFLPLSRLIASLGIPSLGLTMSKILVKNLHDYDSIIRATVDDLVCVDGIGLKTAEVIVEGLKYYQPMIDKMISYGVSFRPVNDFNDVYDTDSTVDDDNVTESDTGALSGISGLSFSISGSVPEGFANRQDFVDFLENHGAVFDTSPKKSTDYMIGDDNDSSSKILKAKKIGLEIITPEIFIQKFLTKNSS